MFPFFEISACVGIGGAVLDIWAVWYINRDDKQRAEREKKLK